MCLQATISSKRSKDDSTKTSKKSNLSLPLATDVLIKKASSFDWNSNDEDEKEAIKIAKAAEKKVHHLSVQQRVMSICHKNDRICPSTKKNDSNQTTINQWYHYHIQSNNTNSQHNARTFAVKTANQLGPVDPFFKEKFVYFM